MWYQFKIFSQSGLIVWEKQREPVKGTPVSSLISDILLENRAQIKSWIEPTDTYRLKWRFANALGGGLVFVVVYHKTLQLPYIDELVETVKEKFVEMHGDAVKQHCKQHGMLTPAFGPSVAASFDKSFALLEKQIVARSLTRGKDPSASSPKKYTPKKSKSTSTSDAETDEAKSNAGDCLSSDGEGNDMLSSDGGGTLSDGLTSGDGGMLSSDGALSGDEPSNLTPEEQRAKALAKLKRRGKRVQRKPRAYVPKDKKKKKKKASKDGSSKKKKPDRFGNVKMSKEEEAALDRSAHLSDGNLDEEAALDRFAKQSDMLGNESDGLGEDFEDSDDDSSAQKDTGGAASGWFSASGLTGYLKQITVGKDLEQADIQPILNQMRDKLIGKNVAQEVAQHLCESVCKTLVGQRLASFSRVSTMVEEALKDALVRILTPKKSTDILRQAFAAKEERRPYVIVFVGVNGVGKSTSLAKVAYYLTQKKLKVMIAACDTFRSGAVEQLKVHSRCLDVPVFEKGYASDPAGVAKDAIKFATDKQYDVVLVDTAGRMQNNEPLMRALAKIMTVNNPDLILFVGEALVGNDAVDQLTLFNRALADHSDQRKPRLIDGIVLTKFDTVDDKVGTSLSMVYKTGQPIMFVGTGQKYTHLRKLNVGTIIKALFK